MNPDNSALRARLNGTSAAWFQALFGLLALVMLAGCSNAPDKRALQYMNQEGFGKRYVGNAEEENYISIGDRIDVFDLVNPEIDLSQSVGIDGTVLLPELGAVPVAGYTRSDLESVLNSRYKDYYAETEIVVNISATGKSFWVIGEVRTPGRKPFTGDIVVVEAILEAVPVRQTANTGRIQLVRGDPRDPLVLPVNLADIRRGDTTTNYRIQENDIIVVPPTFIAEFGYFLEALLFPLTRVLAVTAGAFFGDNNNGNFRNRNNRGLGFGSIF